MFWLKACPKCRGDLTVSADSYGAYVYCLQCGGIKEPFVIAPARIVKQRVSHGGRHLLKVVGSS